jgi:predicted DNA-binding protein YlxM (UPF0122 family)
MDWKTLITDLLAADVSLEEISTAMDVTPNALREIIAGRTKSPRYEAATKLLELHKQRIPQTDKAA